MKIISNALSARRPDWKRERDVMVTPPRKPGDPNPVLRASMERTFETYTLKATTNSSRARLDELLVRLPPSVADAVRKYGDELPSPRRRGRPSGDDNRELTIAREVAKVRAAAVTQGRPPNMKSIYGQVAKRHKLSESMVGKHYRKYREFAEFCEGALQTPASASLLKG